MGGLDKLQRDLARHQSVFVDSAIWSYHFASHPTYSPLTTRAFFVLAEQGVRLMTSTTSIAEVLALPLTLRDPVMADRFEAQLLAMPELQIIGFPVELAHLCAEIRVQNKLRLPDAIQVATAIHGKASAILSNDLRWRNKFNTPKLILLEDYL